MQATVECVNSRMIYDDGRKFVVRYSGEDGPAVVDRAEKAIKQIYQYRSPKRSMVFKHGAAWAVDVTYYGLD